MMYYVTRIDLLQKATWIRLFRQQEEKEELRFEKEGDRKSADYETNARLEEEFVAWRSNRRRRQRPYSGYSRRVVRCWTESCLNRWSPVDFLPYPRREDDYTRPTDTVSRQVDFSESESTTDYCERFDNPPRYGSVRRHRPIIVTEPPQYNPRPEFIPSVDAVAKALSVSRKRRRSRYGCCGRLFRSSVRRRNAITASLSTRIAANISAKTKKRPSTDYGRSRKRLRKEKDDDYLDSTSESSVITERVGVKQRRTRSRRVSPSRVEVSRTRKRKLDIMAPNLPSTTTTTIITDAVAAVPPNVTQQYDNNKVDSNNNNTSDYCCDYATITRTDAVSPKRWRVNAILQSESGVNGGDDEEKKYSNRHSIFMGDDAFEDDDASTVGPRKPSRTFEVLEVNAGSPPLPPLRWRRRQDDSNTVVTPEEKPSFLPVSPPPCGWRSHWDENGAPSTLSATYESYYRQQDDHRRSVASSLASLTLSSNGSSSSATKRRSTASAASSISGSLDPVQRMDRELARIREAPVTVKNGASKFVVSLDMSIFRAEDIQLKLEVGRLTIEAIREAQIDESRSVIRSFIRKVGIPDDIATDVMATELSAYGILTITLLKRRN